jgi:argininosuccinate synthase
MNFKSRIKQMEKRLHVKEPIRISVNIMEDGEMEKYMEEAGIQSGMDKEESRRLLKLKYPDTIFVF